MNNFSFNTSVSGVDEAALLIALCFPCKPPQLVKSVNVSSQGKDIPSRLVWHFAAKSPAGYNINAARLAFHLPKRSQLASDIFQRARIAACNYQALKSALRGEPLTALSGGNYTLLRNGDGTPVPPLSPGTPCTSSHLPSVAIACALGCRLAAAGRALDILHVLPAPGQQITPEYVQSYGASEEAARPENFSDLAVLCAMFKNRAVLMEQAYGRRVVFRNGSRAAIVSGDAPNKMIDKAYDFIA